MSNLFGSILIIIRHHIKCLRTLRRKLNQRPTDNNKMKHKTIQTSSKQNLVQPKQTMNLI